MTTMLLYRYKDASGGTVVSPRRPEDGVAFTIKYRLIADENKGITDGVVITTVVDTESPNSWSDCELPADD